jgi:hypothetical protein
VRHPLQLFSTYTAVTGKAVDVTRDVVAATMC